MFGATIGGSSQNEEVRKGVILEVKRRELWLVRHGETTRSVLGEIAGWSDPPLTERGMGEAEALAPRLKAQSYDGVFSSDLERCRTTARLAWGRARADQRLRELNFGIFEKKAFREVDPKIFRQVSEFRSFEIPGGETLSAFQRRLQEFVEDLPSGKYLLFVHGGVIRALCRNAGLDRFVSTGTLVCLDYDADRILLIEEGAHET